MRALNTDAPGVLYVSGAFTDAGGIPDADHIAIWNGSAWSALGSPPIGGDVHAIAYSGGKVYAGGTFTNAGGNADADFLAVWDGSSWAPFCNFPNGGSALDDRLRVEQLLEAAARRGGEGLGGP